VGKEDIVNLYTGMLFIHIGSATVLVGSSIASPFIIGALRRADDVREVSVWVDFARRTTRANPVAALFLLASGVYLASAGWWGSPWMALSGLLFLVNAGYAARLLHAELQGIERSATLLAAGPVTPALDRLRWSERLDLGADILLGADIAALFLMVNKPTPAISVAVATLGIGGAFVRRTLRRLGKVERPRAARVGAAEGVAGRDDL
jgi:hypothetical protein